MTVIKDSQRTCGRSWLRLEPNRSTTEELQMMLLGTEI